MHDSSPMAVRAEWIKERLKNINEKVWHLREEILVLATEYERLKVALDDATRAEEDHA